MERPLILRQKITPPGDDLIQRMRWILPDVPVYVVTDNPCLEGYLETPGTEVFTEPLDDPDEGRLVSLLRGECEALSRDVDSSPKRYFGRYLAQELIGEGGDGKIFRGWDPLLRRPVAIKQGQKTSLESQRRSKWEGCKVASVDHPHVVQIFDCVNLDDGYALIMEYLPGGDLSTRLRDEKRLQAPEACRLGLDLARALRATHDAGLAHGDVKPANVLIGTDGGFKLADFGAAGSGYHRMRDCFRGTPGYLPPEIYFEQDYRPSSDTYAAGVLLYRALTGELPFTGTSLMDLMNASLSTTPPSCRWAAPNDEVADLISSMMAKETVDRPSLNAVITIFERYVPKSRSKRGVSRASVASGELYPRPRRRPADGSSLAVG
ncbi:MAG: serine/threonine-protein kinase [Acidobacteriota bacterium]